MWMFPDFEPRINSIGSFRELTVELCQGLPNLSRSAFESRAIRSGSHCSEPDCRLGTVLRHRVGLRKTP